MRNTQPPTSKIEHPMARLVESREVGGWRFPVRGEPPPPKLDAHWDHEPKEAQAFQPASEPDFPVRRGSGDWPPSRRSGAMARREGGKVARTGRQECLPYTSVREKVEAAAAQPPATIFTISSRSPAWNWRCANSDGATASPLCFPTTLATGCARGRFWNSPRVARHPIYGAGTIW